MCRKLLCPFGQRPYDGHCKPQTVTMNNLGVWVLLKLIIDWEQTKLPNESMVDPISFANGERIVEAITKEMKAKSCAFCRIHLTLSDATISTKPLPNFDLLLSFGTNPKCQYENIHRSIDVAIGKVIKITFKDRDPIFIKPQYDKRSRSTLSELKRDTLFSFRRSGFCKAEVEPRTPFCPGIELKYSEVQSLHDQKAKRMLDQLFDSGNVNDTSTVFICLSEYFKIVAPINAAVRIQMFWSAALIMLTFL